MKNKIMFIAILLFVLLSYIALNILLCKTQEHKILKVIRADLFYIDLNDNNKADENELFKLKDVYVFSSGLNDFAKENCDRLHIDKIDYLKLGYFLDNWAQDNLLGKNVVITSLIKDKTKKYDYVSVKLNNIDLSEFYLKNGLAYSKTYNLQNNTQIRANINDLSKLNFVLVNENSNIYHRLDCEFVDLINKGKLILFKDAKNYIPCKNCNIKIPAIPKDDKVSFYNKFDNYEIYLTNPLEFKKPDNTCSSQVCRRLVSEINNSKSTIDIAIYGLGDIKEIYKALINAKNRGVKIRAIVDYSKKMNELYPKTIDFVKDFNAHTDKTEAIMHNKFIIFDDKLLMTGSANISPSGIGGYSANLIIFSTHSSTIARYKYEFNQMYLGKFSNSKEKINLEQDGKINSYFSPKDDIKSVILSKINSSKEEICISAFYLTQKDIINSLISAKKRGVKVYIIQDAVSANNFKDRIHLIRNNGILLIVENWGGKDHEKTMLIDNKILIIGSANFSASALSKNDENILIIEDYDISKFYRKYFFYLFNSIDKKYLHLIPRAEGKDSINSCSDGIDNNFDEKIDMEDLGCK